MTAPSAILTDPVPTEPMHLVGVWLAEAWERRAQRNPNSMVLATSSADGTPSARVVLWKGLVEDPGYLLFYTNYESQKGIELLERPRAAAVMHWDYLQRQIRIAGPVTRSPAAESDAYFASRPWPSRIGAWASNQSRPIASRAALAAAVGAAAKRFGTPDPATAQEAGKDFPIARPPHWGGFRLWAQSVELWQEGTARIHDRWRWSRTLSAAGPDDFSGGPWALERLQP
jgi:pyridoxamine 5'-phosphate oxidase